jgi:hypothetical protein
MQAVPLVIALLPVLTSKAPFECVFLVTPEQPTPNKASHPTDESVAVFWRR